MIKSFFKAEQTGPQTGPQDGAEVGKQGSTYDPCSNLPTNQPSADSEYLKYYSLRLTIPHIEFPKMQDVLLKYSKNWLAAAHVADPDVPHEHFHVIILGLDDKKIEAMRKQLKTVFERQGNGFFAGKKMDNHIYKAIQYCKHDDEVTWKWRGPHWQDHIAAAPDYVHKEVDKAPTKRKREADPMLTYSNVLWRARSHRSEHRLATTDLGVVLEHMTRTTNWIPSAEMMRRGLDPMHFKLFAFQAEDKKGKTPDWWTPKFN